MTRTSNARVLTAYDIMLANERARADIEWERHNGGTDALRAASETDGVERMTQELIALLTEDEGWKNI